METTDHTNNTESNELVRNNLSLVGKAVSQASARYPRHVDREELWNAGALGLVEAARRYDPEAGIPFARYAMIRIRGAIIDSTRTRDWASRSVRRRTRELEQATADLRTPEGQAPDKASLAAALGVTIEGLDKIQARSAAAMLLYLDHDQGGEGPTLRDSIVDPDMTASPELAFEHREMLGTLRVAVDHLTGVHRDVAQRYYLDGELLQDIAADLQVTRARVSQIRSEALNSLRAYFGTLYDATPEIEDGAPGKRARASYLAQVSANADWRTRLDAADRDAEDEPARLWA